MLDIKFLRENLDFVRRKILERGQEIDLDRFAALEAKRRNILQEVESLRSERNQASKEIGRKRPGRKTPRGSSPGWRRSRHGSKNSTSS